MRISSLFGPLFLGAGIIVSLTAAPACGSSVPSCQNPTSEEQACDSCGSSNCGSEVSDVESDCSAYVSCYEACDCSDTACVAKCTQDTTSSACQAAGEALGSCTEQHCKSQCTVSVTIDGG